MGPLLGRAPACEGTVLTERTYPADPVAIVGMSCRLPGGLDSPSDYWAMLAEGRSFSCELPQDRGWNPSRLYHPDSSLEGTTYVQRGGFLSDVGDFDAAFFGIGPREALAMDPQQRLLLESCWSAIEDARVAPRSLHGSRTGVYVGIAESGYATCRHTMDLSGAEKYLATGGALSVAAGRISYVLGLHGPAMALDTACSSSLVATHLAMRALRAGECEMALAAGVCVMADPNVLLYLSRLGAPAEDGVSRAFSADARGFGAAEGVAAVLLMPLARALAEGRRVLAVLRGSAVNEDGASQALSVPNGLAQQAVMQAALEDAGLLPEEVDLIEAHGTGTVVGDPIEAASLHAVYGERHRAEAPVWVGSAKSNIGHTQAAAGLTGLIKTVLALRHERMPPTLHIERPLASVDWSAGMRLLQQGRPWPRGETPRRAGVLSYGIGGTNAHVLVEEAPATPTRRRSGPTAGILLWPVYADTPESLRAQAAALAVDVRQGRADAADVGWSLPTTRSRMDQRAVVTGSDSAELLAGLDALVARRDGESTTDRLPANVTRSRALPGPGPVFVFPGQGAQWVGMGARLLQESTVFAKAFNRCARALRPWTDFDVTDVVRARGGAPRLERAEVVQSALFAVYVALAELWQAHGVRPAAVIGHSQGEIAAACVAGALSLEDAAKVVARRGAVLRELSGLGAMASLGVPIGRARRLMEPWEQHLEIAVDNGPAAVAVAGDPAAVRELVDHCARQQVLARVLAVDYASHSRQVEAVRERILAELDGVTSVEPAVPMISATTGVSVGTGELDAAYWYRNLRLPVLFDSAIYTSLAMGYRHFLEVSPHPVLTGPVHEILADAGVDGRVGASLHRDRGDLADFTAALATAHAQGIEVDWGRLHPGAAEVDLPTYRFQRRRFWPRPAAATPDLAASGLRSTEHPWLTAAMDLPDGSVVASGRLSLTDQPWLADHAVHGTALLPATGMIELLAWTAQDGAEADRVEDTVLHAPLVLGETAVDIQVHCTAPAADGRCRLTLSSRSHAGTGSWTRHAEATTTEATSTAAAAPTPATGTSWPPPGAAPVDVSTCYRVLQDKGYAYGPTFRRLAAMWRDDQALYAEVRLPVTTETGGFLIHPALLDAALHGLILQHTGEETLLPYAAAAVQLTGQGACVLRATVTRTGLDRVRVDAADDTGRPIACLEDLRLRQTAPRQLRSLLAATDQVIYRPRWQPVQLPASNPTSTGGWAAVTTADDFPMSQTFTDMASLCASLSATPPEFVVLDCRGPLTPHTHSEETASPLGQTTRERLRWLLRQLQTFLSQGQLTTTPLLVLTRHAESTAFAEAVQDLAGAACVGMAASAASEHPAQIQLLDLDMEPVSGEVLATVVASQRPRVAIRNTQALVLRLVPAHDSEPLTLPMDGSAWRLTPSPRHTLEDIRAVPAPDLAQPVAADRARVRVSATGANFRDAAVAVGLIEGNALGFEAAGTISAVGAQVTDWQIGDRVLTVLTSADAGGGYASHIDAEPRHLRRVPDGTTLAQAAGLPIVYATAYHALIAQAGVRAGEKVLIHAAAGGVGMAVLRLARERGAEIYATASPAKHPLLHAAGIVPGRVANSRTLEFETQLRQATDGTGFDVVVGSLAGEAVDASLRLLRPGGRYIELGLTDIRDPDDVAAQHPGVSYTHLDLRALATDNNAMSALDGAGISPLPTQRWNVRYTRQALRHLAQGRSTGKMVLAQPVELSPDKTVLITGGTGTLGALLARHLVTVHGVRHLLLLSRQGERADSAPALRQDLQTRGATVTLAACDAADRTALAHVLSRIPAQHPLGTVIHAAGTLDDALLTDLTPKRLDTVLRTKVDAALNLHDLTADTDLQAFVLYSSLAGTLGNPGQANYAAANTFLDAFAHHRRHQGLPAISIAWGLWQETSGLTAQLSDTARARLTRHGLAPLSTRQALAAFDAALDLDWPHLAVTRCTADTHHRPDLFAGLPRRKTRSASTAKPTDTSRQPDVYRLRSLPPDRRHTALTTLVRAHAAEVLGYSGADDIDAERSFRDLGFDSLASVELRT
ncbi:SDR family NAD(P)-dependent oxidoreductase [Streptomyces sp. DT2A-34]|nr:type I polyketide synthase [Streptomyces sp. DT2A-34]MDO0909337.1 SDR family NAD(P)-dependent oxidoreductase [Streptomyces sp. DT2A-34]